MYYFEIVVHDKSSRGFLLSKLVIRLGLAKDLTSLPIILKTL